MDLAALLQSQLATERVKRPTRAATADRTEKSLISQAFLQMKTS